MHVVKRKRKKLRHSNSYEARTISIETDRTDNLRLMIQLVQEIKPYNTTYKKTELLYYDQRSIYIRVSTNITSSNEHIIQYRYIKTFNN